MPLLYVIDFDGTLFRSPVPHPDLGHDWVDFAQASALDGMGLSWFSHPETLSPQALQLLLPGAAAQSPPKEFYVMETVEMAWQAHAAGHRILVLTGRLETMEGRIREILRGAPPTASSPRGGFPPVEAVKGRRYETQGTVKFKASQITYFAINISERLALEGAQEKARLAAVAAVAAAAAFPSLASLSAAPQQQQQPEEKKVVAENDVARHQPDPSQLHGIVMYDDRPEQMQKICEAVNAQLPSHLHPKQVVVETHPMFIADPALENALLWRCLCKIRDKLSEPRVFRVKTALPAARERSADEQLQEQPQQGEEPCEVVEKLIDPQRTLLLVLAKYPHLLAAVKSAVR